MRRLVPILLVFARASVLHAEEPSAAALHAAILDDDPWGRGGGEVRARATVQDGERRRELSFEVRSLRHDPPLGRSLLRFFGPADVAGVGLLVSQNRHGDDDRYLFLPELKRARRVAQSRRREVFMGTDFSYGDMDRRELRNARVRLAGEEILGRYPTYKLVLEPTDDDAQYDRVEVWVRKEDRRPLKYVLSQDGEKRKTLLVKEIRRIDGRAFATRSVMIDHGKRSRTEIVLDTVDKRRYGDEAFTVSALEQF